jgi:hypothetical protein
MFDRFTLLLLFQLAGEIVVRGWACRFPAR